MSFRNKPTLYKVCLIHVLSYARVAFTQINPNILYKLCIATGCRYYIHILDIHKDLELLILVQHFQNLSVCYFTITVAHSNQLVEAPVNYDTKAEPKLRYRRPHHVLTNPDDPITAATAANLKPTNTPMTLQHRRRSRRH